MKNNLYTRHTDTIEYGYNEYSRNYYTLHIDNAAQSVTIAERTISNIGDVNYKVRATISLILWMQLKKCIEKDFNISLKEENMDAGYWVEDGDTRIDRNLGKELLILIWATEHLDMDNSKNIERLLISKSNWLMLTREKRWWMYTMITHENLDRAEDKDIQGGWRYALRFMF